ncbi:DUF4197 family protein, partial [Pseudomonas syringae group genomosp. 7]|uniref:DUF4197 family protein n=1 Tax=Pseudomonas syringae group genomosp. 7 TaxID=251699 RepID=UPI0037702A26
RVSDAKAILVGVNDSGTQYLICTSGEQFLARFLPFVKKSTDQVCLAQKYNAFEGKAAAFGALESKRANLESYVTEQALNCLFEMNAKQEESNR